MDLINTRLDSVARSEKDFYIQVFPTDDLFEWKWAYIAVDVTFMDVSLLFQGSAHDAVHILQAPSGNGYVILFISCYSLLVGFFLSFFR